jgi:hypothetical protein
MRSMHICIPVRMYSHALQEQTSHTHKKKMQNAHVVSRPKCHALSNGALIFAASSVLCTGKWMQLFTEAAFHSTSIFST